jgi:very-short-patch-repair endonuclease
MDLETAINYVENLRSRATQHELIFKEKLDRLNLEYIFQYPVYGFGWFYIIDFYIPKLNKYIELDGSQHEKAKKYDKLRSKRIYDKYKIVEVRIKNKDVCNCNILDLLKPKPKSNKKTKPSQLKYKMSNKDRVLQAKYDKLNSKYI